MFTIVAAVEDDGLDGHEHVAVGAGLAGTETDVAELSGFAADGLNDDVCFSAASIVVQIAVHELHGARE